MIEIREQTSNWIQSILYKYVLAYRNTLACERSRGKTYCTMLETKLHTIKELLNTMYDKHSFGWRIEYTSATILLKFYVETKEDRSNMFVVIADRAVSDKYTGVTVVVPCDQDRKLFEII